MKFEELLKRAKSGDKDAQEEVLQMYRPLLIKNSMDMNVFDEDLYQELSATLLQCIARHHITKELKMDIRVADMKILDTSQNKDLLGQVITDVVLALLSYVAEGDWEERHELQRQGIEVAKEAGKYLGRPRIEFPENWEECYHRWKGGVITAREAMKLTGLKKDSFYRLVKKYENPEESSSK